ncbi:hypothetical protein [Marinimicrobium sp. C2-29]|uniref:hypothetical protein n=1 Tax=Marinimicrobium sp. C2-29 TaxID=3139825 RepID=UPI003138C57D
MFTRLIGLVLLGALASASAEDYEIEGKAYNVDDIEQLLYVERYTPVDDNDRGEVHYESPEGERLATKTLDYSAGNTKPDYELIDERGDRHWSVTLEDGSLKLSKGPKDDPETDTVSAEDPQVIDAGFDAFVQLEWDKLMDGKRVTFHFAFPNRLTNVRLRAVHIERGDSPIEQDGEDWVWFQIRVDSALMSLFADSLYLAYERDTKRLMVFRGRSNLPAADGDSWDVEIRYTYSD